MSEITYGVCLGGYLEDHKIEAIKAWRRVFFIYDEDGNIVTSCGLREAKDKIDDMQYGRARELTLTEFQMLSLREAGFLLTQLTGVKPKRVTVYINEKEMDGRKIEAIKRLRRASGYMGLKETKDIIDYMWKWDKPVEIYGCTELMYFNLLNAGFTVEGFVTEAFKGQEDLFII